MGEERVHSCPLRTSLLSWKASLGSVAAELGCLHCTASGCGELVIHPLHSHCSMGGTLEPGKPQARQLASLVICDHQSRQRCISKCQLGQDFVPQGTNICVDQWFVQGQDKLYVQVL